MTDSRNVTDHTFGSLAQSLGAMSDDELVILLRLRPDLTTPIPASMDVLASRAMAHSSILRAADDLDTAALVVLETIAGAGKHGIDREHIAEALAGRATTPTAIDTALARLRSRALVWGEQRLRASRAAGAALPRPTSASEDDHTTVEIIEALADLNEAERALLDHLARTTPIGRTRDAAPGTPADRPVQRLLAKQLLHLLDEQTVALPPPVAAVLHGERVGVASLAPPPVTTSEHVVADVDAAAAGEVLELLRHCRDLLGALGSSPAPSLKSGGLGVREIRKLSKQTGIDVERIGLQVEVLAAAGLLAPGFPDPLPAGTPPAEEFWGPTPHSDTWLEQPPARRWVELARAWLSMPRQPWLIGMRDAADKPIAALSVEAGSILAPRDRRTVLDRLAALPTGHTAAPDDLVELLCWHQPRRANRFRAHPVAHTMAEAGALGILGRGTLSTPGRALLRNDPADADPQDTMAAVLPAPVDHIVVQADLTVVAPGPLTSDLERAIIGVADQESTGGATVYRITANTVRRALDTGGTAAQLHALFEQHSRTPVPQALTYLIDDVARKHATLRVGMASAFLRSDDPARLAEVMTAPVAHKLALRAVAPTVAICPAPPNELLDALRTAGFAPAAEDSHGAIVSLRPRGARVLTRRSSGSYSPPEPSDAQLHDYICRLRANDRAARACSATPEDRNAAAILNLLASAARSHSRVTIGYVDIAGVASHGLVEPLAVGGGKLDALDPTTDTVRHFALHRITNAALAE